MKLGTKSLLILLFTISGSLIDAQNTDQKSIIIRVSDGEYPIDSVSFEQLKRVSQTVRDQSESMEKNELSLFELDSKGLGTILALIKINDRPAELEKVLERYTDLLELATLYKQLRFLDIEVLVKAIEKRIIQLVASEKDGTKLQALLKYLGPRDTDRSLVDLIEKKIEDMIADNLKQGMYNFVLEDELITKPLSDKTKIDSLIEASQTLKNLQENTGQKDATVFYLTPISKKTFENLYALIPYLSDAQQIAAQLADNKSYGLLPIALLLKAADFLAIEALVTVTLKELAKRLLTTELLKLFQEGRNWGSFLGLSEDLESMIAQEIIKQAKVDLVYLLRTLSGHAGSVYSVAWSPDGKQLATGSNDNTAKIWDTSNRKIIRTLPGDAPVTWSSDGKYFATGSSNKTVKIWDRSNWNLVHIIKEHTDDISSVAWGPDGKLLVTGSSDKTATIWLIIDERDFKYLTLDQALLIAIASEEKRNNRSLKLNDHLKQIYETLTPTLKELLKNAFNVIGG